MYKVNKPKAESSLQSNIIHKTTPFSGVGRGGRLWVLEHPPPPETYLLFSDVFAVSTPFVRDLDND